MNTKPAELAAVLSWSRRGGQFSAESVEVPAKFSDDALALRFTAEHGNDLRYTSAWGRWNRWDGHRWTEDDTLRVYDLARGTCRDAAGECKNKNVAQRVTSANTVAAVERLARSDRRHAATVDQWDADPWLLNTPGALSICTPAICNSPTPWPIARRLRRLRLTETAHSGCYSFTQ